MNNTRILNSTAGVGAIDNKYSLTVEHNGITVFEWDKVEGHVTFRASTSPKKTQNQLLSMNTALDLAGWNNSEFVIWKNNRGELSQLVLTGRDGAALGWINLDDKNNLSFKLMQADLDRNETN